MHVAINRLLLVVPLAAGAWLAGLQPAAAQEFRIYTRIVPVRPPGGDPGRRTEVTTRTLSLFRAGKVYDYIDSVGEVIVYEPAQRRFVILSTAREVAATLEFEDLKQLLSVARFEAEHHLVQTASDAADAAASAPLRFQLSPEFAEQVDRESRRLRLTAPELSYDVRCVESSAPEVLDAYLRYADWIARLNYVLHPQALFPEPRLALNTRLRRLQWMPVEVELRTTANGGMHLRAEHKIHWHLDAQDRSLIQQWETLLQSKRTRWVSFRDYRNLLIVGERRQRQ